MHQLLRITILELPASKVNLNLKHTLTFVQMQSQKQELMLNLLKHNLRQK